ncbi:type II secretion system protein GspD [Methylobacterium sp. Leaf456]|uniref:type II secretion system secretin GspD n=1 Tax=Methylobacterium sp. Leaf456 TaxID=1736382 RepID=UPI0006FB4C51|nr:type II secretion system secretin GspD [Methylobacterium sp. Leaf456]KQT47679.1 type II secretion system protein GspD [Methylobacterium sp. Leaf456]
MPSLRRALLPSLLLVLAALAPAAGQTLPRTGLTGPEMGMDLSAKPIRGGGAARPAADAVTQPARGVGRSRYFGPEDVDRTAGTGLGGLSEQAEAIEIGGGPAQDAVNGGGFRLNFERAEIKDVVHAILSDTLGLNYTMGADVSGQITISSPRPLSRNELLASLESVLAGQGFSMSKAGTGYRIVPAAAGLGTVNLGAGGPGYGVSVVPLRYVSAATMSKLVSGFVADADGLRFDATRNTMIVKGPGPKRQEAVSAILAFDADWMRGQTVSLFELKRARPEAVVAELTQLFDTGENGSGQGLIQFKPIGRLRAVLATSKNAGLLRRAEGFVRELDGTAEAAEETVFVYKARYRNAVELARVVNGLFGGGNSGMMSGLGGGMSGSGLGGARSGLSSQAGSGLGGTDGGMGGGMGGGGMGSGMSSGGMSSTGSGLGGTGVGSGGGMNQNGGSGADLLKARFASAFGDQAGQGQGNGGGGIDGAMMGGGSLDLTQRSGNKRVSISADPAQNAVVTYTDGETYRKIHAALQRLDATPVQVAINVTIAEVRLTDQLKYGVQYFLDSSRIGIGGNKGSIGLLSAAAGASGGVANKLSPGGAGFNFLVGGYSGPDIVISALDGFTDVKILSSPSLVVLENQPATLQVGDSVPITTTQATSVTVPGAPLVNQVEMRDTGIILNVIPRIGQNGAVTMQIEQEISAVVDTVKTLTPTISKRRVASMISVPNGQTVLLAGLIQEKNLRGRDGIPFLSRLANVGDLFSSTDNAADRTELVVFIRPVVVRSGRDAQRVAEDYRGQLYDAAARRGGRAPAAARPVVVKP